MKKLFTIIILMIISIDGFSQSDNIKREITPYLSTSFSTSTGDDFKLNSYYGVETGIGVKNLMFGLAGGRGNIDYSSDNIRNYWYEIKTYASVPIGSVRGFVVIGWGQYFKTGHSFLEYGAGAAYTIKRFDISLTVSNWDKVVYVTPGVCYNFNSIKLR